jgi:hypothetical protein
MTSRPSREARAWPYGPRVSAIEWSRAAATRAAGNEYWVGCLHSAPTQAATAVLSVLHFFAGPATFATLVTALVVTGTLRKPAAVVSPQRAG